VFGVPTDLERLEHDDAIKFPVLRLLCGHRSEHYVVDAEMIPARTDAARQHRSNFALRSGWSRSGVVAQRSAKPAGSAAESARVRKNSPETAFDPSIAYHRFPNETGGRQGTCSLV
jgi:hypothetical protein